MSLKQINENLWVQELDLGVFEVCGALILGEQRAVIWDTLSHPRDMAPYLPLIGEREIIAVYSHADWDHVWGTAGLPQPVTIIGHAHCRERFGTDVPEKLRKMQQAEPGKWDEVQLIPPTIVFQDDLLIELGGVTVALHHLPGHTLDCLVAILQIEGSEHRGSEHRVALMGDTIETPFPIVYPESPVPAWIEQLKRWAADTRITTVIPSHGPIGGRDQISETIDYLEKLQRGKPFELPESMTGFYQETHEANLKWQDHD